MKKLQVAIVGCGKIADGHVQEINHLEQAEVVAVCDREGLMAEQLATRLGVPRYYDDFTALLRECPVDVVHVTTPPQSHFAVACQAVDAGAHVLVEKPVALSARDTRDLIRVVQSAGRKLTVNYWYNFEEPALRLRTLIDSGALGQVVHLESSYGYNFSGAYGQALLADHQHWVHKMPGGVFQNVIDHALNKVVPYLPDAELSVVASSYPGLQRLDKPSDELRALIRSGGVSAHIVISANVRPIGHCLRAYGTKGTATVDFNMRTLTTDVEQSFPGALGRLTPPFALAGQYLRNAIQNCMAFARSEAPYFRGMRRLFEEFYRSILNDTPAPIHMWEIERVAEMTDAILAGTREQVCP